MFKPDKIFLDLALIIILTIATFLLFSPWAFTQSIPPYIYYQGKLLDQATGAPVNQIKSITFSLYNTDTGGTPIYQQTQDINIKNGVFSVYLGQGEGSYNGNPVADGIPSQVFIEHSVRYLGIKLEDSQIEMYPRQLIVSAPYAYKAEVSDRSYFALEAKKAENLMEEVMVNSSTGNVGIGNNQPSEKLEVSGNIKAAGSIKAMSFEGDGSVLTGIRLHSLDAADGDPSDMLYVDSNGNVGIDQSNPTERLEVNGNVRINGTVSGFTSPPCYSLTIPNYEYMGSNICPPGQKGYSLVGFYHHDNYSNGYSDVVCTPSPGTGRCWQLEVCVYCK